MDGGWSMQGTIHSVTEERIVLEEDGRHYLAYRKKISGILMNADKKLTQPARESDIPLTYHHKEGLTPSGLGPTEDARIARIRALWEASEESEHIDYADSFIPIPEDMLVGEPDPTQQTGFSISMTELEWVEQFVEEAVRSTNDNTEE